MDPSFSYAIRTSECKSHRPPCGPGITLRQEYEYLSNQIIRLRYENQSDDIISLIWRYICRSILLETDILDENTYTDDIIQRNLTDLLFQIEKVILDMKGTGLTTRRLTYS